MKVALNIVNDIVTVQVDLSAGEYADSDWDFLSLEELAYFLKPYLDKLKDE